MSVLSEAMKNARLRSGLSIGQVARDVGVHRNMVYRWERGKAEPSAKNLHKFSVVVGIPISELYDELSPDRDPEREMLAISKRLLEADRRNPGTVERLMLLIRQGFLDTPEDLDDLLSVAQILKRRSGK